MSPRPARASFGSSPLVRCLADLGGIGSAPSTQTVAERLSHWLAWTDAIALSAALGTEGAAQRRTAVPPAMPPRSTRARADVLDQARRTRAELARRIGEDPTFSEVPADDSACRAAYRLHQRTLAESMAGLRTLLRAALAARSAEGAELAAIDAVLERALAPHERSLLAGVPTLLGRHGAERRKAAAQAQTAADTPWQQALLAELDTRWQPLEGLIASLGPAPGTPE